MIIAIHEYHPNIIGPCCMVLGKRNINISGMQVGSNKDGNTAIMVLNMDSEVNDDILKEIEKVKGILDVKNIYL